MVSFSDSYLIFAIWSNHWSMKNLKISSTYLKLLPKYGSLKYWAILIHAQFWKRIVFSMPYPSELIFFKKIPFRWRWTPLPIVLFQMSSIKKLAIEPYLPSWINRKVDKIKTLTFLYFLSSWIEWLSDDWQYFSTTRVRIAYFNQKSDS